MTPRDLHRLEKEIVKEVLGIKYHLMLSVEELAALSRLQVALFMQSSFRQAYGGNPREGTSPLYKDRRFRDSIRGLAEGICHRSEITSDPQNLALLCTALFELTRTGLLKYTDDRLRFESKLFNAVSSNSLKRKKNGNGYRPLHAMLSLLMQEPLTTLTFDHNAPGFRRYNFTLGKELYETTLRQWADTQKTDGSWSGICLEEALCRIDIFEADFGSIEGIDNKKITDTAYEYYSKLPITTASELAFLYHAYVCRWFNEIDSQEMQRFVDQARTMLAAPTLTPADRYLLQYVLFSATTEIVSVAA